MNHVWVKREGVKTCTNCGTYVKLEHPPHVSNPVARWAAYYTVDGRRIGFIRPDCPAAKVVP